VQKADLRPTTGNQPDHITLDEAVIQLTDQRYCLYTTVDPGKQILYIRLYSTRTTVLTEMFLRELREKHAVFLVDSDPWLKAVLHHLGL
jgi:transposase-like protein